MINQKKLLKTLIFACGILFWTYATTVKAQPGFETRLSIEKVSTTKKSGPAPPRLPREKVRTVTNTVTKVVTKRPSDLSVTTEPDAKVLLEPLSPKLKKQTKIANKAGGAIFENLTAGKYRIVVEKENFETLRQDDVVIEREKNHVVKMELEPIMRKLVIETNVMDGEVRYAPADYVSEKDGSLVTKESGVYCFVPIKNKKAVIGGLKNGYYNIDIRPSDDYLQYNSVKTALKVSDETVGDGDDPKDEPDFTIPLETKFSTAEFNASAWTSADWSSLANWKLSKKMKTDGLSGIALPRNDLYRYYADFQMISNVRSLDDKTIGFVLRAEDEKNYYLVQISGEKASDPLVVKPFIVRNGVARQLSPFPISHLAKAIKAKKYFGVIIKGEKNRFRISIEDGETGEVNPVGEFEDPNSNFPKGAVGIAGDNSDFEVGVFRVCAGKCS